MECRRFVIWIEDRLEGSLSGERRQELDEHLARCARCRAELMLQTEIRRALGQEPPQVLSPDFARQVNRRVTALAPAERRPARWLPLVPSFGVAIMMAVLTLLGPELTRALPPISWPTDGGLLGAAYAWSAEFMRGAIDGAVSLKLPGLAWSGRLNSPMVFSLLISLLPGIPAVWGLYRVYSFLRD